MKTISLRQKLVVAVVAIIMAFAFAGLKADAKIVQTAEGDKSISFEWDDSTTTDYSIGFAQVTTDTNAAYNAAKSMAEARQIVVPSTTKSWTISALANNAQYVIYVRSTYGSYNTYYTGSYSSYIYTKITSINNLVQEKWWKYIKSVEVKWDEVPGNYGTVKYEVVFMNSKGKVIERKTVTNNHYEHSINNNTIYTVKVQATRTPNPAYSKCPAQKTAWSTTQYLFTQPTVTSAKVKGGKLTIKWGKMAGATSYDIYVSTKQKKGFKKVGTVSSKKNSFTIKKTKGKKGSKFKASKTYYVYVCANKKVKGKVFKKGVVYGYSIKGSSKPSEYWF